VLKYRENEGRNWLDNLKLGYGGTKGEMERLIADANKVKEANGEMANLSIDSFADVTEAIHIIQTEMGITGTTSKEASTTIEGSVKSMKSAYQNFLTGLANGNADMGKLMQNLVDSVLTAGNNILPAINQIAQSIIDVLPQILNSIIEALPQFLEAGTNILNTLITGIQQNMPAIMQAVLTIVTTIINTILQNLPQILQMGIQVIVSLIQGIAQQLPTLIPQMVETVLTMVETLIDNIDLIIDAGIQLLIGLAEGLIEALPQLIDKIPIIIDKLVTAIVNNLPKLIEMGITLIVKLAEGLIKAIPQLVSKIPQIISSLVNGIISYYGKLFSIGGNLLNKVKDGIVSGIGKLADVGKNLVQGLWNGINNAKDWVLGKIKGFGKSILNGIKGIFGIHSPSTVFRDQVGKNLALGLGEGFEDEMKEVTNEMQNAIPTSFDTDVNIGSNNIASGSSNYYSMVDAFKEALSEMKIELDDEVAGRFVETTVTNAIYN
jgi:phage-related protein